MAKLVNTPGMSLGRQPEIWAFDRAMLDRSEAVRYAAAVALAELNCRMALTPLRDATRDPSERVAEAAKAGLDRLTKVLEKETEGRARDIG